MARARSWVWGMVLATLAMTLIASARPATAAQQPAADGAEPSAAPGGAVPEAETGQQLPWQPGPLHVDLGHDLSLDLNEHYMFLARDAAAKVLEQMGSFYHDNLLGLATSTDVAADWFVVIRYDEEGYIKDDEKVDADELLQALREGSEEANEQRKQHGFKPLALDGWAEAPHYDPALHHLVWGLIVSDSDGKSVNYNTRVLGRRGFASLNLVTDPSKLASYRPEAAALLAGTHFGTGARYEDFDAKSDKTAEYGLTGLIAAGAGVGAAKLIKIGLFAKLWKVILTALIAGKKLVAIGLIALGAYLKKLFGERKKTETAG